MTPLPVWSGSVLTDPPERLRRRLLIALVTVTALVVVGVVLRVTDLDVGASVAIHHLRVGALGAAAEVFYLALRPEPAALLMLVATAGVGVLTRSWVHASVFLAVIGLTWGSAEAIKLVVGRPRPGLTDAATAWTGTTVDASFPSGHVAFTAAFVAACACLVWRTRWRRLALAVGAVLVGFMALAVVIVGAHHLGDAMASVVWVAAVFPAVRGVCAVASTRADAEMRRRRSRRVV